MGTKSILEMVSALALSIGLTPAVTGFSVGCDNVRVALAGSAETDHRYPAGSRPLRSEA